MKWWHRRDSNSHALRPLGLSQVRIPIPPQCRELVGTERFELSLPDGLRSERSVYPSSTTSPMIGTPGRIRTDDLPLIWRYGV